MPSVSVELSHLLRDTSMAKSGDYCSQIVAQFALIIHFMVGLYDLWYIIPSVVQWALLQPPSSLITQLPLL